MAMFLTLLTYVRAEANASARPNWYFTDNCSDFDSQLTTCVYCGGEGGFYEPENEHSLECFEPCPECRGSGYQAGEPADLSLEDLDLRAPIDSLLKWWSCLTARDAWPEQRERIAGECDRRLSWQYRVSEC